MFSSPATQAPWQPSLFGGPVRRHPGPLCDVRFRNYRRLDLGRDAWVEHHPGWLSGHAEVFETLARTTDWNTSVRQMYDQVVETPRLTASLPDDGPGHPAIDTMSGALSDRFGHRMDRVSLAYYRDGRDSVAWHGDRIGNGRVVCTVAIVSVGEPRRFLLRPAEGGKSLAFSVGWGDLMVMGGTCQRTWQHTVPKQKQAGPRICIMFRHDHGA